MKLQIENGSKKQSSLVLGIAEIRKYKANLIKLVIYKEQIFDMYRCLSFYRIHHVLLGL